MQTILYFAEVKNPALHTESLPKGHKKTRSCGIGWGGDKWTRTTDSRIFSPMLYQLSYITDS